MKTLRAFEQSWPSAEWAPLNVIVAVSGGSDSVALLRLMLAARTRDTNLSANIGKIIVAHFDHRWRPDSADDADWVATMAASFGLEFRLGQAADARPTSEQAARQARYAFLTNVAEVSGARYIATGHTADDQAETVMHNIIRGTGIAGLAGIPRARVLTPAVTLLRPLLELQRDDLRADLETMGQPYREDPTNAQPRFTRNRLRHELIPHLVEHYNPDVESALIRLGKLAQAAQQEIASSATALYDQVVSCPESGTVVINLSRLHSSTRHLVRELLVMIWKRQGWPLRDMTFGKWEQLAEQALAEDRDTQVQEMPGALCVRRVAGQLTIRRDTPATT